MTVCSTLPVSLIPSTDLNPTKMTACSRFSLRVGVVMEHRSSTDRG